MRLGLILAGACAVSLLAAAAAEGARPKKKRAAARRPAQARPAPGGAEYLNPPGAPARPFSEATRVNGVLYLSGQLGTDPETSKLVSGGVKAETKQTLENIRRVLERHGSSLDHVFKCTVMLADMAEWGAMNEVYVTFFKPDRRPSRSAFGTSGLALGARVEIECWATGKN